MGGDIFEIDDLIILGRSVPSLMRDGRRPICAAGFSPTHGFIRLYPTFHNFPFKRWNIIKVPVERAVSPRTDPRPESYKIRGPRKNPRALVQKVRKVGELDRDDWPDLLAGNSDACVMDIKDQGRSLGIIKPDIKEFFFSENEDYSPFLQSRLDNGFVVDAKHQFPLEPRVRYSCPDCKTKGGFHDQQILEWGVYEFLRKFPEKKDSLSDNLRIFDEDYEKYFFVGDQLGHRFSYMVISVHRYKK
ncbi:hypothetical protein H8E77_39990 [bacterium]|nr:hypothetical protein [bacterium]